MTMADFDDNLDRDDADEAPSKSQLKREKQALQDLGKRIAELPKAHYARMPLTETMQDAMALYKRLTSHEAKRRQLQYIGKHMHLENLEAIGVLFEHLDTNSKQSRQYFHKLETLRDRLIEDGDSALDGALLDYPHLNRQEIRQLVRQANKEKQLNKPPAASRKLFQYLRDHIETSQ